MEKSLTMKIAAVAVVIVIVVAACALLLSNNKEKDDVEIKASLMVRGNADNNYKIDQNDMDILEDIIAGNKALEDYPLADVNKDGKVDETDKKNTPGHAGSQNWDEDLRRDSRCER